MNRTTRLDNSSSIIAQDRVRAAAVLACLAAAALLSDPPTCLGQTNIPAVAFSSPTFFAYEDSGSATITVVRSGDLTRAVTVNYATGKGLATSGVDYTPQSGTLSFARGETNKTFAIPLLDDTLAEGSEPVELSLSNPTGGAVFGALARARLYVQDNENRGTLLDFTFTNSIQPADAVNALALQPDGKIWAGGTFASDDPTNPNVVIRVQADGHRDTGFEKTVAQPNNAVYAMVLQADGKAIIGGEFTAVGSAPRNRIARLNSDGTLDTSFNPGAGVAGAGTPAVYSVALQRDGKVLIGGIFDTVSGVSRIDVARLNADGSLDPTFQPGAGLTSTNRNFRKPWISAVVAQPDGKTLLGGQFTEVDGLSLRNIARLNADGSVDSTFDPGLGATGDYASVEAIAVQPDGKIIIGGDFDSVNGLDRRALARLNPHGSVDSTLEIGSGVKDIDASGADLSGLVTWVIVQGDGKILFGGSFLTVDEINRHGLARINGDGSLDGTFGPYFGTTYRNDLGYEEMTSIPVLALQPDGKIVIGGTFASADGSETNRLSRLLSTNVRTSSFEFFSPGIVTGETSGSVSMDVIRRGDSEGAYSVEFAAVAGTAVAGGDFAPQSGVLQFDKFVVEKTITVSILNDGSLEDDKIFSLVLKNPAPGASLGAPTNFVVRIIDGKKPGNLDFGFAEVDIPYPDDPTSTLPVTALVAQDDGKTLLAGNFTSINGEARPGIARLNRDGTVDLTFAPAPPQGSPVYQVLDLGVQPDGRIIGGYEGVFRLNRDGSLDRGFDPGLGSLTSFMVQKDGSFVVSDEFFDRASDSYLDEVMRYSLDGAIDPFFSSPVLNDWVTITTAQPDGKVIIGGYFTQADGVAQNRLARLNGNGSLDPSFNIGAGLQGTNSAVYALALQPDGKVLAAGSFLSVNNVARRYLVRLNADGIVDSTFNIGTGPNNVVAAVVVQPDGKILIGGAFVLFNGLPRFGLARLHRDGSLDTRFVPSLSYPGPVWVNAIAVQRDSQILIAGLFGAVNGVTRYSLARLNGDGHYAQLASGARGPAGQFHLTATSWPGQQYRIEVSSDLVKWLPVKTNLAASFTLDFEDPTLPLPPARFYRAVVLQP